MLTIQQKLSIQEKFFRMLDVVANPFFYISLTIASFAWLYVDGIPLISLGVLAMFQGYVHFRLWRIRRANRRQPRSCPVYSN